MEGHHLALRCADGVNREVASRSAEQSERLKELSKPASDCREFNDYKDEDGQWCLENLSTFP